MWRSSGTHGAKRDVVAANDKVMDKQKQVDDAHRQMLVSSPVTGNMDLNMPCLGVSFHEEVSMRTQLLRSVATATLALCVIAGSASAQGKGKGHDKGDKGEKGDRGDRTAVNVLIPAAVGTRDGRDNRDIRREGRDNRDVRENRDGRDNRDVRENDRDGRENRDIRGNGRRVPPGLAKKGGLPPGQAKKMYRAADGVGALRDVFGRHGYTVVRTEPYGTREYVYYRQGTTGLVQRAVIYPGADRLAFQNVPQALLQEVLARLH